MFETKLIKHFVGIKVKGINEVKGIKGKKAKVTAIHITFRHFFYLFLPILL